MQKNKETGLPADYYPHRKGCIGRDFCIDKKACEQKGQCPQVGIEMIRKIIKEETNHDATNS